MRLLILAYFFPPDLSAGSFRMASLLPAIAAATPPPGRGPLAIEVLTTLPNRYASFTAAAPEVEELGSAAVERVRGVARQQIGVRAGDPLLAPDRGHRECECDFRIFGSGHRAPGPHSPKNKE